MKKMVLLAAVCLLTFSASAQVSIPEGYALRWQKNFVDYAVQNVPGATKSMVRLEKADFDATDAPKFSTKEGGRQFYHVTSIGEVSDQLTFWPNKEFAIYNYYSINEPAIFIGLRFTRNDGDNMIAIDNLKEGDIIVIGASDQPILASKNTTVRLMIQNETTSQDFVYGGKHRTFKYTEYMYQVTKDGSQVFQFDLGWMLYDIRLYSKN